ncbi:MAG: helix-turn-helix transcriptional regulator [candidate division WOR-3 bacterium]|nr:helix-turn-helix transcriptional regulator [candidate division WOR-3 bacterium]
MKRPKDRYDCDEELGKRLRECRLKAGLTQQKLATAMGRQGKGSHHVAGRLERGEVPNPGVGLLADYLRACRAGFADIQDVLDRYTAKQTVVEVETSKALAKVREFLPAKIDRAVERFDRGIRRRAEEKHEPLPLPQERVRRARSFALSQVWARRVRRRVVDIIETEHLRPGPDNERYLQSYAVRVWSALNRSRGRRAGKRPALLEQAARLRAGEEAVRPEHLQAVRDGLIEFFGQAEMAGQLDVAPQFEPGETQPRYGFQPKPDRRPERDAWDKARAALVEELWQEVSRLPELAGLDPRRLQLWRSLVRQLCSAVDHHAPESDECKRQVEAMATDEYYSARGRAPALVRRLAVIVIPRWEELRQSLGPHPLGRARPPGQPK